MLINLPNYEATGKRLTRKILNLEEEKKEKRKTGKRKGRGNDFGITLKYNFSSQLIYLPTQVRQIHGFPYIIMLYERVCMCVLCVCICIFKRNLHFQ